jgi:hypothetical protein
MKSSSTRRVLKSVVGPALGATLGALVAGGCAKEEAKPAPTTTQPDTKVEAPPPPAAEPPKEQPPGSPPPTAVEPEKPGAKAEPADASVEEPAKKPAPKKEAPPKKGAKADPATTPPKKDVAPAPPSETPPKKGSPSTEWYAGTMLERDIRPMRPARRGTDATVNALLTGLHDPALRPLA